MPSWQDEEGRLTLFAETFIFEYVKRGSVLGAWLASGGAPTAKHLAATWWRAMRNDPLVAEHLDAIRGEAFYKAGLSRERIVQELARVGMFDLRDALDDNGELRDPSEWPEGAGRAIESWERTTISKVDDNGNEILHEKRKIKAGGKIAALRLLSEIGGLTKSPDIPQPVNITLNFAGDAPVATKDPAITMTIEAPNAPSGR
jgi:hypothetical protein